MPLVCPICRGAHLITLGIGNAKLSTLLAQHFPDTTIARWDTDIKKEKGLGYAHADIIIGTQLLLHDLSETLVQPIDFGVIIATCLDDLTVHSGFRAYEQAWRTTQQLMNLAATTHAELFLQTFDGENPMIRQLLEDQSIFLPREIEVRKKLGYPPAISLITITEANADRRALDAHMATLRKNLEDINAITLPPIKVFGPLIPTPAFRHGKWRSAVAIKTNQIVPAPLLTFLQQLPDEFLIDRD